MGAEVERAYLFFTLRILDVIGLHFSPDAPTKYIFSHLESVAFAAAGVELWEDLDDFHGEIRD